MTRRTRKPANAEAEARAPAVATWYGWIRRLGPPGTSRAWMIVAEGSSAAAVLLATERWRYAQTWVVAEWCVLPPGKHPASLGRMAA